jgi:hypothetical protein
MSINRAVGHLNDEQVKSKFLSLRIGDKFRAKMGTGETIFKVVSYGWTSQGPRVVPGDDGRHLRRAP